MLQDILHRQTCWLRIKTALNLSFQFQCLLFPIELDRTSWKIRNRRDENTCLCLTLSCRGMTHCFTTLTASAVNLSLMPFTGSLLLFLVSWKLLPGVDVVYVNHLVMSNSLQLHELCGSPGSSVHGISQAKILEWIAIPFSRGSSWSMDWTQVSPIAGRFFTIWATRETPGVGVTLYQILLLHVLRWYSFFGLGLLIGWIILMKLKDACSLEKKIWQT